MELPARNETGFDGKLESALQQSRDGMTALLGQLLEAYRPYLLQIANSELDSDLKGKADGSDLVQQTFMEANKDIASFRGQSEAELIAWLRRILLNNLANFRRQYRSGGKRDVGREVPTNTGNSSVVGVGELRTQDASPSSLTAAREQTERLGQAMARLSDDHRQAIEMRHQQNQSFAQIGSAMGRSSEAARKLWARAIEALHKELNPPS